VSPAAPIRNVPYTATSRGGPVEEDSDEYEGTSTSRGAGASEGRDAAAGRRSQDVGAELPAGEETLAAISRRRSQRAPAPQRRKRLESGEAGEIPTEGAAAHPREVFRDGTEAIWANAGSGTLSGRGWAGSGRGDVATLDVSGGVVEPHAEAESAPEAEGAPAALWRLGAAGWKLSRLVRGTWTSGMSDEYGG